VVWYRNPSKFPETHLGEFQIKWIFGGGGRKRFIPFIRAGDTVNWLFRIDPNVWTANDLKTIKLSLRRHRCGMAITGVAWDLPTALDRVHGGPGRLVHQTGGWARCRGFSPRSLGQLKGEIVYRPVQGLGRSVAHQWAKENPGTYQPCLLEGKAAVGAHWILKTSFCDGSFVIKVRLTVVGPMAFFSEIPMTSQ